jgi:hypothetical protein
MGFREIENLMPMKEPADKTRIKVSDCDLRWLLLLEENKVTFEYLQGKKNSIVDGLSCYDIDSLKMKEEEVLTLLSGSDNSNIRNIKSKTLKHTVLFSTEQIKKQGCGIKRILMKWFSINDKLYQRY